MWSCWYDRSRWQILANATGCQTTAAVIVVIGPAASRTSARTISSELGDELSRARSGGLLLVVGAVAAIFSLLFLLLACVDGLSHVMPDGVRR